MRMNASFKGTLAPKGRQSQSRAWQLAVGISKDSIIQGDLTDGPSFF